MWVHDTALFLAYPQCMGISTYTFYNEFKPSMSHMLHGTGICTYIWIAKIHVYSSPHGSMWVENDMDEIYYPVLWGLF